MKTSLFLILFFCSTPQSLKFEEIKHNVIPFFVDKTYISESKHTLMYHYNLNNISKILNDHYVLVDQLNSISSNMMVSNYVESIKIQIKQNKILLNNLYTPRQKRGLVNVGGHIAKVLFGTLDTDDESLYLNYFHSFENKIQSLKTEQNQVISVVRSMTTKYSNATNQIIQNYNHYRLVQNDINRLILTQFEELTINRILTEINTAISFARLHLLHESILPSDLFFDFVNSTDFMKHLYYFKDFYSVCYTSVKIRNKDVIFIIEVPLTSPNPLDTYYLQYVPYQNVTLTEQPKYLLAKEEQLLWSINEECPKVEDWWICPQNMLQPVPSCMKDLIYRKTENCKRQRSQCRGDLLKLSSGKFLSTGDVQISEVCNQHTEYYKLNGIYLIETTCNITNNFKFFYNEEVSTIFHNVPLPSMKTETIENLTITDLSIDNSTIQETVFNWKIHPNHVSSIYFTFNLIIIFVTAYFLYKIFIAKFTNIVKTHKNNSAINAEVIS